MNKAEVIHALDVIDKEYKADIRKTEARFKNIKELVYQIPNLKAKYETNSFTEKEASIIDEYEKLKGVWPFLCLQRKDEKIRALKDKIENDAKEILQVFDKNYSNVLQGTATNSLSKVKGKHENFKFDSLKGVAETIQKIGDTDFTVMLNNFSDKSALRTSTHKLLTALLIEFTETGSKDTSITLSLGKYMEWCGLKNKVSARRQVNEGLETLYNLSIRFEQKKKEGRKRSSDYIDTRLVIKKGIKNGVITCVFNPEFYELLKSYTVMPVNKKMLALDDRYNPHAFYFLKKLCEHVNMNYGEPNQNVISVESLLRSSPEMPTYEEIQSKNRVYKQLIIEPFIRDMNVLQDIYAITWKFDNPDCLKSWYSFTKAKVHFELVNYPIRALPGKNIKKKV